MSRLCVDWSLTSGISAYRCDRTEARAGLCDAHFRLEVRQVMAAQDITWPAAVLVVANTPREVDPRALQPRQAVA